MGRRKTTRIFKDAEILEPSEYELILVTEGLTKLYEANENFLKGKTIEQKIKEVIASCKKGWKCAPTDFIKRVETKTKWNSTTIQNRFDYKPNYYNQRQIESNNKLIQEESNLYQGEDGKWLRNVLNKEDKKFWVAREAYYRKEFDLNDSADWPLLQQILVEELHQNRLAKIRLTKPHEQMDQALNESYKRLITAMKTLGITREQRQGSLGSSEGSISQLSQQFEQKKKLIEKQMQQELIEEKMMEEQKKSREGLLELRKLGLQEMALDLARAEDEEEISIQEIKDKESNYEVIDDKTNED